MSTHVISLGSFKRGVTNRKQPTRLADRDESGADVHWLLGADNVDLYDDGFLARRQGVTRVIPGKAHSLWCVGNDMLAVLEGDLVAVDASMQARTLLPGMGPHPVSYIKAPDGHIYFTNGTVIRRLRGHTVEELCPLPPQRVVATVGPGTLSAGRYQFTATVAVGDNESASFPLQVVDVPKNSSITISVQAGAGTPQVYVTSTNGSVLAYAGSGARVVVSSPTLETRPCLTQDMMRMPAGQIVRYFRGRLLVASDNVLWLSRDYHYALCKPDQDYLMFPERITVVEPTDGGVYICADKTYWMPDYESGLRIVDEDGGVFGTSGRKGTGAFWHSPDGLVTGSADGQITKVQEDALLMTTAARGASLYRKQEGAEHILTTRQAPRENRVCVGSFIEAEMVREGVKK